MLNIWSTHHFEEILLARRCCTVLASWLKVISIPSLLPFLLSLPTAAELELWSAMVSWTSYILELEEVLNLWLVPVHAILFIWPEPAALSKRKY